MDACMLYRSMYMLQPICTVLLNSSLIKASRLVTIEVENQSPTNIEASLHALY